MSKNNEQLVELIKDVVSGNKEKDVFCKEFYKEVYAIVYPVFGENSKKVTSRAFIYLCDNLDKIDVSRNVHRQIATLVSTFMFGLIDKKTIKYDAELSDYEFNRIKDDVELYNIIRDNVKMFKNPVDFERASDSIKELTRVQTIVLELYGYEMHSVEEIEELLDMDSAFIYGIIGQIKAQILGINISVSEDTDDAMEESGVDVYEEQEENDEYVPEYDNESEEEQPADSSNDEDEADSCSEEYIYMRKNARKKKGPDLVVEKLSELLGKLFPDLSHTARNMVVYVAGGIILLAIVISIFLSAILSGGANSANKKNSSGNTRVTIAETVTAHEKTTKAKKTKKTQADTEADNNATTKADTTKNNNNNNNTDRKDIREEATEESDDEDSDGGDEEEMEEEKEKPSEEDKEKPSEEDKEKPSEKETPSETQSDSNKTQETKSTEEKNTETSTETKATEENTKATKATEAVDNTTAAADINASNN